MPQEPTNSEAYVYDLSRHSFLSLWSYLSPQGKEPGKELCDILVVCDPHVIIISVKEVALKNTGRPEVDAARWQRRAITESVEQLAGAERWLNQCHHVTTREGDQGIDLPKLPSRVYHRIAIALGANRRVSYDLKQECPGNDAFVHVMDEAALEAIFRELDTITDFAECLAAKEKLFSPGRAVMIFGGGEEDILAIYLHYGRIFPHSDSDALFIEGGLWRKFQRKSSVRARKEADRTSYFWDELVDLFARDVLQHNLEPGSTHSEAEFVARTMARENRFCRRVLGSAFIEFLEGSRSKKLRSRCAQSLSGVTYVFLATDFATPREHRKSELKCRCMAAIARLPSNTVVGIATEIPDSAPTPGASYDFFYLWFDELTDEIKARSRQVSEDLEYFKTPQLVERLIDEYPLSKRRDVRTTEINGN